MFTRNKWRKQENHTRMVLNAKEAAEASAAMFRGSPAGFAAANRVLAYQKRLEKVNG